MYKRLYNQVSYTSTVCECLRCLSTVGNVPQDPQMTLSLDRNITVKLAFSVIRFINNPHTSERSGVSRDYKQKNI